MPYPFDGLHLSGHRKHERTLLLVARGAAPPEPGLLAVAGCNTVTEIGAFVLRRPDLIDRVLIWRSPATEQPVLMLLIGGEAVEACQGRLREALEVTPEEAARPPAVRQHQERAANRDLAALVPLIIIVGTALLLSLVIVIDPFAVDEPRHAEVPTVEIVCAEAPGLCESASLARGLVQANECTAAIEETNRLAAVFIRLPEAERTGSLERALNALHEQARRCTAAPASRPTP